MGFLDSDVRNLRKYIETIVKKMNLQFQRKINSSLSFRLARRAPKPPLCKGRCQKSLIFDGGVVKMYRIGHNPSVICLTIGK